MHALCHVILQHLPVDFLDFSTPLMLGSITWLALATGTGEDWSGQRFWMCLHSVAWFPVLHHCPRKSSPLGDAGPSMELCRAALNLEPSPGKPSRTTADSQDQTLGAACQWAWSYLLPIIISADTWRAEGVTKVGGTSYSIDTVLGT